ncbi:hypothetical protein [Myroides sp.]|uniref:hypothetical protein n=1 Tax=Myroides sp. TaxID=1874736 RepID=UPI0028B22A0E|nr:hypothetical protein [Myroides sp.]
MKNDEDFIFLNDALKLMNERLVNGQFRPFNISFRTFNGQNSTGGKLRIIEGARLLPNKNTDKKEKITIENVLKEETTKRPPNHWTNRTRNIELPDGNVRKIRIDFIISINNKKVIY